MGKENQQQRVRETLNERESKWRGRQRQTTEMTVRSTGRRAEKYKSNCMYCCSGKKRRIEDWQVTGEEKQKLLKNQTNKQRNKQTDKATISS